MNPIISIIIPVYNGAQYIGRTIESIQNQTFKDFELILVDDCSTDDSLRIIEQYKNADVRIKVYKTYNNLGTVNKVLNFAEQYMAGKYFLYSSQDDLYSDDWLQKMYDASCSTGADAVIPDMKYYYDDCDINPSSWCGLKGDRSVVLSGKEAAVLSLDWTVHGFMLWRADMVKRIKFADFGMYDSDYSVREFFFNSEKVVFSEGVYYYRQDNPSAITKKITYKRFDLPYQYFMLYLLCVKHGVSKEVSENELGNSLSSLVIHVLLLNSNATTLSKSDFENADERLEKCFNKLKQKEIFELIKKRRGITHFVRRIAISWNYAAFKIFCILIFKPAFHVAEFVNKHKRNPID